MTDRILRPAGIRKKYGGISNTKFYEWVKQGKIPKPKPIVPGGRATGVRESGNRRGHRRAREGRIVPDVATPDAVDWDALDSVQQASIWWRLWGAIRTTPTSGIALMPAGCGKLSTAATLSLRAATCCRCYRPSPRR